MTAVSATSALPLADSPLGRTIALTDTDIWNDSCAIDELEYALSFGAVGATANPTIVVDVWRKEPAYWRDRVTALAAARPDATLTELAWVIVAWGIRGPDRATRARLIAEVAVMAGNSRSRWGREESPGPSAAVPGPRPRCYRARSPVSPVRTRTTESTGTTQILPSPILPVWAAVEMACTT